MALSRGDDYPIHQTPDPVAYAGTDRNFYDRYFFNGYAPDGSGFFAAAFGVYPHLDVADAHFCVVRNGVQHCLHASRHLGMERMALECGPIRIEIIQPLQQLRVIVDGEGIAADITFTGRAFPIEEPRFTWRVGPRTVMDYTRLTQNGHYDGWIEVDGAREALPSGSMGTRDRSWGVRPIGAADPQFAGRSVPQFFWQWTPINMGARSIFFHLNAHADGTPWNTRAVIVPDGAGAQGLAEHHAPHMASALEEGTRWPAASVLAIGAETFRIAPLSRFQMRGLGYTSPRWGHGLDHGTLEVEREDIVLADIDPARPDNLHVQMLCRVTGPEGENGMGVFEQLAIGDYAPLGLTGLAGR
ncbi:hypothetical protein [Porphyrobacter sp. CACIAM 03H1]|uniref:hypothetical protein n=1 Tax=Porphyrobacter sp. CACIAM 03H1 TaxID=2003315 RepID=UPI000B5A4B94|nr:hypothetical protein [Porphyrobacter sp. CACIAM 03H1]ASJ91494.1 hypothetical protein CBR61_11575 [Porphyrobacter sp. CACIAM 03H1]